MAGVSVAGRVVMVVVPVLPRQARPVLDSELPADTSPSRATSDIWALAHGPHRAEPRRGHGLGLSHGSGIMGRSRRLRQGSPCPGSSFSLLQPAKLHDKHELPRVGWQTGKTGSAPRYVNNLNKTFIKEPLFYAAQGKPPTTHRKHIAKVAPKPKRGFRHPLCTLNFKGSLE